MKLTNSQQQALDLSQNIIVEAGAGSGKTTVFVQRYLSYFKQDSTLEPSQVLAITFTNLAAQELLMRIQHSLLTDTTYADIAPRLLTHLSQTSIMTIHGFCKQLLQQYPIEAVVDPCFSVLDDSQGQFLIDEAIQEGLASLAQQTNPQYKHLHALYSMPQIVALLKKCFSKKELLPKYEKIEASSFQTYLEALFFVFGVVDTVYQQKKDALGALDYVDLLLKTKSVLLNKTCLQDSQQHYRYILVDEFQDTDSNQWHIIQQLCDEFNPLSQNKLFLVGDIKQSIYGFRGAEADLFLRIFEQFEEDSQSTGVHMAENFRSQVPIISFVNQLFSTLFTDDPDSTIPYTQLKALPDAQKGAVQFCLNDTNSFEQEAHLLAQTIQTHLQQHSQYTYKDIAILFRRRMHFKQLKDIFSIYNIPVQIDYTPGFYHQSIIMDAYNVITMLLEPYHKLAWFGALRSPVFNISDSCLFLLQKQYKDVPFFDMARQFIQSPHADFSATDRLQLAQLFTLCIQWQTLLSFETVSNCVDALFTATAAWDRYAEKQLSSLFIFIEQCDEQLEKENFHHKRFMQTLHFKMASFASPSLTPEADNAVQLLTIHASKGLEFPIVIIAECHHPFHLSLQDALLFSSKSVALSHKQLNADDKKPVVAEIKHDTKQEAKRLFYVACTRAKDFLFLSGHNLFDDGPEKEAISFFHLMRSFTAVSDKTVRLHQTPYSICFQANNNAPQALELPLTSTKQPSQRTLFSPHPLPMPLYRYSVSDIELYINCPKQLIYKDMFKLLPVVHKKSHQSSALLGTLTHKAFELFFTNNLQPNLSNLRPFTAGSDKDTTAQLAFIQTQLHNLSKSECVRLAKTAREVITELPFSLHIDGVLIDGRIDLVLVFDDTIHIIDYKTDRIEVNDHTTFITDYLVQLSIYQLAVQQHFGDTKHIYTSLYLSQSNTLLPVDTDASQHYKSAIQQLPAQLSGKLFNAPPQTTCQTCSYYALNSDCPASTVLNN